VSQTNELARVKARIKALAEKWSPTVGQKPRPWRRRRWSAGLLERCALTMDEIEVREQRCVHVEVRIGGPRRRLNSRWWKRSGWCRAVGSGGGALTLRFAVASKLATGSGWTGQSAG